MKLRINIGFLVAMLAPATAFVQEQETIELNAVVMPKTNVRGLWYFGQELVARGPLKRTEKVQDAFGLAVEVEMPIWNYFAAGFYFQGYRGLSLVNPQLGTNSVSNFFNPLSDSNPDLDVLGYNVFGAGAFIKPQVELPFSFGKVALSLRVPFGFESVLGTSRIGLFKDQADMDQFRTVANSKIGPDLTSGVFGLGIRSGATLGLEYYPSYLFGVFAEGGYEGAYHLFAAKLTENIVTDTGNGGSYVKTNDVSAGMRGYYIHGWTAMVGLKTTY